MDDKPILFESLKAASAWTGYPLSVVKLAKASGCNAFVRHTVDLQKLVRWIASAQKAATELPEGIPSWAEMHNKWKSEREKIRLEKDKGHVLDVDEVCRHAADAEGYYFNELERLLREMPAALVGLTAAQVRERLGKFLGDLRARSREKFKVVGGKETNHDS